jgi:hypothetical protein
LPSANPELVVLLDAARARCAPLCISATDALTAARRAQPRRVVSDTPRSAPSTWPRTGASPALTTSTSVTTSSPRRRNRIDDRSARPAPPISMAPGAAGRSPRWLARVPRATVPDMLRLGRQLARRRPHWHGGAAGRLHRAARAAGTTLPITRSPSMQPGRAPAFFVQVVSDCSVRLPREMTTAGDHHRASRPRGHLPGRAARDARGAGVMRMRWLAALLGLLDRLSITPVASLATP